MSEIKRSLLSSATSLSDTFDFERASLAVLAKHKHRSSGTNSLPSYDLSGPCRSISIGYDDLTNCYSRLEAGSHQKRQEICGVNLC